MPECGRRQRKMKIDKPGEHRASLSLSVSAPAAASLLETVHFDLVLVTDVVLDQEIKPGQGKAYCCCFDCERMAKTWRKHGDSAQVQEPFRGRGSDCEVRRHLRVLTPVALELQNLTHLIVFQNSSVCREHLGGGHVKSVVEAVCVWQRCGSEHSALCVVRRIKCPSLALLSARQIPCFHCTTQGRQEIITTHLAHHTEDLLEVKILSQTLDGGERLAAVALLVADVHGVARVALFLVAVGRAKGI